MVSNISSLELSYLVREFQQLVGAKVDKIFSQPDSSQVLFTFHLPGVGKRMLFFSIPGIVCLSSFKPSFPQTPPHFSFILRKRLSGARLRSVSQHHFERILLFTFETRDRTFNLVVELFSPGNMVLTDGEYIIQEVLNHKVWNDDRKILPKKPYVFPPAQLDPTGLSFSDFSSLLASSDRESIVKSLAIDCSLGGVYAEEIVALTPGLDKTVAPGSLSSSMLAKLFSSFDAVLHHPVDPVVCNKRPFPFRLSSLDPDSCTSYESFNSAVSDIVMSSLEREDISQQHKSLSHSMNKYDKILSSQRSQLKGLERAIDENQKKGELIYNHYADISTLLSRIRELRNTHSWAEIKEMVKDNPSIVSIDESTGSINLDIE